MRVKSQVLQRLLRTGEKSAQCSERFRKRAIDNRNPVLDLKFLRSATPVLTARQHRVRFVNKCAGTMRLGDVEQLRQISKVAVHRINPLDHNEFSARLLAAKPSIKRGRIIVLELFSAAA